MVIDADVVLTAPLELSIAGEDQRGLQLGQQQWWWDPRPWLIHRATELQIQGRAAALHLLGHQAQQPRRPA